MTWVKKADDYYLEHHGILGMHWGQRNGPPYPLDSSVSTGKRLRTTFVSGSSKTQDKKSPYYQRKLSRELRNELKKKMRAGNIIIVGDAPGIDRQVQDYLKKKRYKNVEVYSPGKESRYLANKKWKNHLIDDPKHEPMSPEWLAKKDKAMAKAADDGIAVILDQGSQATRNNIKRLQKKGKEVSVYTLNPKKEKINPIKAKSKIDRSLSKEEQNLLGVGNNYSTKDVKFFFNKDKTAYLITEDYHGKFKDEHPVSGKIISVAAMPKVRGTGTTDKLIKDAKETFKNDRLVAEIDDNNISSRKLFERNGFKKIKEENHVNYYVYGKTRRN